MAGYAALLTLVVTGLAAWLVLRFVRKRLAVGEATAVERRFQRTVAMWNAEVDRFKFTAQGAVITLLNHDHAVWTHVEAMARTTGEPLARLRWKVYGYVDEIVPFFKPLSYYGVGYRVARWLLNRLYRVEFDPGELERIRNLSSERPRSVVYVMNHRSNVDYVLAAYVLRESIALSFAVGEWARIWPLEYVFKSFGSYFIRRGYRDPLYHTVLRRYVQLVTKNGVTQALFPEGGLSRDGRLRAPKLGLLDYIICSKEDRSFDRELVFVPVAINYDRVLEDRQLVAELRDERPPRGRWRMLKNAASILFGNARKYSRGQIKRHGIAAVRFGEPVSFDTWHATQKVDIFALDKVDRRGHIAELTNLLMERIAALVPATPLCVVAKVLLARGPVSRDALVDHVRAEGERLRAKGVLVVGWDRGAEWIVLGALERFAMRHLVLETPDSVEPVQSELPILRYYASSLAHFDDGIVPKVEPPRGEKP